MALAAAMVTPNLTLGGAERWLVDLIKHTDPHRVRWTGCAISGWGGLDRQLGTELRQYTRLTSNKIPASCRPPKPLPFARDLVHTWTTLDFRRAIKNATKGARVVVTWGDPNMSFWFKELKYPRVICSHTTLQEDKPGPVSGISHLTAVSAAAMRFFDGREGNVGLPRQVLYNGVDPARVCPQQAVWQARRRIRSYWGLRKKEVVVGYLGRQGKEKNPFAAAKAVLAAPPHHHVVYYGNGPSGNGFCPELMEFCDRHLPHRYQMHAPVACVGDVLPGFDVLVLASHREAFSLALIEAWLNGVPVIATPVGSIPELEARYGKLVFRVPLDPDENTLREAVEQALEPSLRREVVERARQVAWQEFTVQAMAERWMDYLEEIAA